MGQLAEMLHEATQSFSWSLRQGKEIIKHSRALVSALERIDELLAQFFPRVHRPPWKAS
jgi:hypothetical protein